METSKSAADPALAEILKEISVPLAVLEEAKRRRDRVLAIAEEHDAAREGAGFASGSVAHGTTNRPLEDADCGIKVNRRFEAFRVFGPDAAEDRGPEAFIKLFSEFVLPASGAAIRAPTSTSTATGRSDFSAMRRSRSTSGGRSIHMSS